MTRRPGDVILKDPQSVEPQGFDWTAYLEELNSGSPAETIETSTWTVSASSLTLSNASIVTGGLKTQVMLTGGRVGQRYTVTNHIVTSSGVHDDRSFVVDVQQR